MKPPLHLTVAAERFLSPPRSLLNHVLVGVTVKGVEGFAVPDDGQRVVVVEFVVKLVGVGVGVRGLWRAGHALRRVVLLTGVVCVTALRTDGRTEKDKRMISRKQELLIAAKFDTRERVGNHLFLISMTVIWGHFKQTKGAFCGQTLTS